MVDIFWIFLLKQEIFYQSRFLPKQVSKKLINQLDFYANRMIYFWNKMSNQIKNSNGIKKFKIELDDFMNNGKKKNLRDAASVWSKSLMIYFLFICWWRAKFSQIWRGWISNKTLAFNFNGKHISGPVILLHIAIADFHTFPALVDVPSQYPPPP